MFKLCSCRASVLRDGIVIFLLATTAVPSLADGVLDGDIDWVETLRAYYIADVVYDRCGLYPTWDQVNELDASIDDAESQSLLSDAERLAMKAAVELQADLSQSQFCAENGRYIRSPEAPE